MHKQHPPDWKRPVRRRTADMIAWFSVLVHARYRRKPRLEGEARRALAQHGIRVTFSFRHGDKSKGEKR